MVGSVLAGMVTRRFGSKLVLTSVGVVLVGLLIALAYVVQTLPAAPGAQDRQTVLWMIGVAAAVFSAGIATLYVVMALGYPASCRSAGIGFGIFLGRVGAISASGGGGALLDLGHGSVLPFFGVLTVGAILVSAASFVIDRHVPASR
jgi:AAHS family 4-hydroxybenzoate transporter-like MFS transporter